MMRKIWAGVAACLVFGAFAGQTAVGQGLDRSKLNKNTPPPVAAATGLKDDFTTDQWGTATDSDKSIEYADEALRIIVYTKNYFVWSTPDNQTYSDVHMEATVRNPGTDSTTALGFMCDQQSAKGSFYYLVMTPAGEYAIAYAEEGKTDVFLTNNDKWGTSDAIAKNSSFYRIGADCGDGRLTLYVDGQQIASVSDSSYTSGGVGLMVWSGEKSARTEVSYDDFVLTSLQ